MSPNPLRTLLLVAFPPEWSALAPHIADTEATTLLGGTVLEGTLAGLPVILAQTGVSMVNAALTTQALIDRFPVDRIILSGVAGGLDPALNIGEVLAPARWGQFLEVGFGRASLAGQTLPPLPGATDLPPFGAMIPRDVLIGDAAHRWFEADPGLLSAAGRLSAEDPGLKLAAGGLGTSGSAFVDNAEYRRYLHATFGAQVIDMESAAVMQVAAVNRVPCLALRAVSDLAGGEDDGNALPHSLDAACGNAARAVLALCGLLRREESGA